MRLDEQALQAAPPSLKANLELQKTEKSSAFTCRWEIAFVAAALLVVSGHLLIKAGLNAVPVITGGLSHKLLAIITQPTVLLGLGIYGFGTLCWMSAVAQTELSLLYPLTSLNYVLIAFLSYLVFGEKISVIRGSGIALIALGMVLLTRSQRKGGAGR
jgi:small multidrug resistance pump